MILKFTAFVKSQFYDYVDKCRFCAYATPCRALKEAPLSLYTPKFNVPSANA